MKIGNLWCVAILIVFTLAGSLMQTDSTSAAYSPAQTAGIYDVKAFGAKGDGKTVDSPAINKAIEAAVPGNFLSDVSAAIQTLADEHHFGIVREFCGHGIGRALHEDPPVLNYVQSGKGPKVKPGLVIAIEPMINLGSEKVKVLEDGWTVVTLDGRPSAHFEHTIAVTPEGPEILTRV